MSNAKICLLFSVQFLKCYQKHRKNSVFLILEKIITKKSFFNNNYDSISIVVTIQPKEKKITEQSSTTESKSH